MGGSGEAEGPLGGEPDSAEKCASVSTFKANKHKYSFF